MKNLIWTTLLALAVSLSVAYFSSAPAPLREGPVYDQAYQRVESSGVLRCGYALWPTFLDKDPNTGALSGIIPDVMAALGTLTGLKIEWTEEVSWVDYPKALEAGRIDAMCTSLWVNAGRARLTAFTQPLYYSALRAYVRAGDARFDADISLVNDPAVTLVAIDGITQIEVARTQFPQAKLLALPQQADASAMLLSVTSGKADVTISDPMTANRFMAANPGQLRAVPLARPISYYANTLGVSVFEPRLLNVLNAALAELQAGGAIAQILRKYEKGPDEFLRVWEPSLPSQKESVQ